MRGSSGVGQERSENCPEDLGPDFDFGLLRSCTRCRADDGCCSRVRRAGRSSRTIRIGREALLWKTSLVEKPGAAEILFGGAADDQQRVLRPEQRRARGRSIPRRGRAEMVGVSLAQGPRRGCTAALTAIPGVVFSGGQDGVLRALDSGTGKVVWQFNMLQDFKTVNGLAARGGGMGAPGPVVAGGMLLVGSGYVGLGNGTPGNVLLAFTAAGEQTGMRGRPSVVSRDRRNDRPRGVDARRGVPVDECGGHEPRRRRVDGEYRCAGSGPQRRDGRAGLRLRPCRRHHQRRQRALV